MNEYTKAFKEKRLYIDYGLGIREVIADYETFDKLVINGLLAEEKYILQKYGTIDMINYSLLIID